MRLHQLHTHANITDSVEDIKTETLALWPLAALFLLTLITENTDANVQYDLSNKTADKDLDTTKVNEWNEIIWAAQRWSLL